MADVFISYSRKDIAFARLLHEALTQGAMETWIDWALIPVGEKWWDEICTAIEQTNIFLFIISCNSIGSEVCRKEIDQALSHNKRIIPVIVDDTPESAIRQFVPDLLAINWVIFKNDNEFLLEKRRDKTLPQKEQEKALPKEPQFRQALEKLNKAIHTDWPWVKAHTRLENRALEWERGKGDASLLLRGNDLRTAEEQLGSVASQKKPQSTDRQRGYVLASRKAETTRRQRIFMIATLVFVILVGLSIYGFYQNQSAKYQTQLAQIETSRRATQEVVAKEKLSGQLAARSSLLMTDGQVDLALLLSIESYRVASTFDARNNLLYLMQSTLSNSEPRSISTLQGYSTATIQSLAFSPDGKLLASGDKDGAISLWDIQKQQRIDYPLIDYPYLAAINSLAFSPDSTLLASGHEAGKTNIWNSDTYELVDTVYGHFVDSSVVIMGGVQSVAFSPNGEILASGGVDGTIQLRDVNTRQPIGDPIKVEADGWWVNSVAFSPNGEILASGGSDGTIRLWDVNTRQPIGDPIKAADWVSSIAFSPKGDMLASGDFDGTIRLWDVNTHQSIGNPIQAANRVNSVAFSPKGDMLASGDDSGTVQLVDVTSGEVVTSIVSQLSTVRTVAFSADGQILAFGGEGGAIQLWNVASLPPLEQFIDSPFETLNAIAFNPDSRILALGGCAEGDDNNCKRGGIRFWNISDRDYIPQSLTDNSSAIEMVKFPPDNSLLASVNRGGSIALWDMSSNNSIASFITGIDGDVAGMAFSPDSKTLVVAEGSSSILYVLDMGDQQLRLMMSSNGDVTSVAYGQRSPILAIGHLQGTVTILDMAQAQELDPYVQGLQVNSVGSKYTYPVTSVALSSDEQIVVAGGCGEQENPGSSILCEHGSIRWWNLTTHQELGHFLVDEPVWDVAISPDGTIIAASVCGKSYNREDLGFCTHSTVQFWDVTEQKRFDLVLDVGTPSGGNSSDVSFSPDGQYLAIADHTGVILWNMNWESLLYRACEIAGRNLTREEWSGFFGNDPYHKTCSQFSEP